MADINLYHYRIKENELTLKVLKRRIRLIVYSQTLCIKEYSHAATFNDPTNGIFSLFTDRISGECPCGY